MLWEEYSEIYSFDILDYKIFPDTLNTRISKICQLKYKKVYHNRKIYKEVIQIYIRYDISRTNIRGDLR